MEKEKHFMVEDDIIARNSIKKVPVEVEVKNKEGKIEKIKATKIIMDSTKP